MIRGDWAATTGSIDSSVPCVGAPSGDPQTSQHTQARLRTSAATGGGVWTTPVISGSVASVMFDDLTLGGFVASVNFKITDDSGATLFNVDTQPPGMTTRLTPFPNAGGSSQPIPVNGVLTVTLAADVRNGDIAFIVRIYVNPAGS